VAVVQYTFTQKQYTTQFIWEERRTGSVFATLQLRKKHGQTSVTVAEECQLPRWKQNIQNRTAHA